MRDVFLDMPPIENEADWHEWFEGLPPSDRKEVEARAKVLPRAGPMAGPQREAFKSEVDQLGYGGAAGGGKSALIAMKALLLHERSVIFRYDAKQLRGLIDDLVNFYGTQTGLNRQAGVFMFSRPGHMCEWGGIGGPGDEHSWRGRAHDFLAADEATELDIGKLRFLATWLRTTKRGQNTQAIYTFNPPGSPDENRGKLPDGRWVIEFFAPWIDEHHSNPAGPGETRWFITLESGEEEEVAGPDPVELKLGGDIFEAVPRSRTFIPATVQDNKYLAGSGYQQHLMSLPEPLRSQMLLGDFRRGIVDSEWQVIPSRWVDIAQDRWTEDGRQADMDCLGVDVARGGRSATSLARRHGYWWDEIVNVPGKDTPDGHHVASLCTNHARDGCEIAVDTTGGYGASPYDIMKRAGMNVFPVQFAARKGLPDLAGKLPFFNMRAALWWMMRMVLDPANGFNPALPKGKKLRAELVSARWGQSSGKILIESKQDIIDRIGYSPDDAEAVILSLRNLFETSPDSDRIRESPGRVDKSILYAVGGRRRPFAEESQWMSM